jgi:hypothetical protein
VALWETARPHHEAALKGNPSNPVFRRHHGNDLRSLCNGYVGLGDHAKLAATVEDLARLAPDPANDAYAAVCVLCTCVTLANRDAHLDGDKRQKLVGSYGDRAMAQLRQAIARGWKGGAYVLARDAYLNSLRARDDFRKLVGDLEKARARQ